MNTRSTLPLHTGRAIPVLGLGTWELTRDTAGTLEEALQIGYRLIDTSGDYGTQPGIADAIRRSGVPREQLFLVTKVEEDEDAYEATRRNLDQLERDHADLMLIHRPPDAGAGEGLWQGLIRAREDGLTRDIGVSNYSAGQIEALVSATGEVPVVNQIEWTPFGWSEDMFEYCRDRDIRIQAYSPLTRATRLGDEALDEIAARYDRSPAQILIRWNLQRGVVPIPKANARDHLAENLRVFDFAIEDEDMAALDDLNEAYSALGELPYV